LLVAVFSNDQEVILFDVRVVPVVVPQRPPSWILISSSWIGCPVPIDESIMILVVTALVLGAISFTGIT
jgi:hypothetical protein